MPEGFHVRYLHRTRLLLANSACDPHRKRRRKRHKAVAALHDEIIVAALLLWYDKIGPKNQLLSGVTI